MITTSEREQLKAELIRMGPYHAIMLGALSLEGRAMAQQLTDRDAEIRRILFADEDECRAAAIKRVDAISGRTYYN